MEISTLYSTIFREKWLIDQREINAHTMMIDQLINHELPLSRKILSDSEPMSKRVAKDGLGYVFDSFEEAPEGSTAIIALHGTMMKYGTWCAYGTQEIAQCIMEASASDKIESIVIDIDSGGGAVNAVAPLLAAIAECKKRNKGCVAYGDLCASAAYYVACHTDAIIASNSVSSQFGSIGVLLQFADYAKYYEEKGIKIHTIYSNLSEYKNAPYEAALKGDYEAIKAEELDPIALGFQEAVKKNRCSLNMETKGLLNGRMFYADEAVRVGLADEVGTLLRAIEVANQATAKYSINHYITNS